jgi:hypothetical protein
MTIKKILPFTLLMAMTALTHQVQAASEDAPTKGAYVTDEQRFFIEGQSVTEVIETANTLVCYISNMRPEAFISDGAYQAKVYEERCVTTGADATAEQASASATSSQSSTTASSGSGASEIDTESAIISTVVVEPIALNPADPFEPQAMTAKAWVDNKAESADEFDTRVYLEAEITKGQTDASPNGEFEMRWSIHSQGIPSWFADLFAQGGEDEKGEEGPDVADFSNINLGQGLLSVSGSELKFKEYGFEFEGNVALDYLDSGDVSGVYGQPVRFCLDCSEENFQQPDFQPTFRSFASFYQFNISEEKKQVCTSLGEVYENCFERDQNATCAAAFEERDIANADNPDYDAFRMIKAPVDRAEFVTLAELNPFESVQLEETCYSTKSSDAQRNVFRYGVYDSDGARAKTALGNSRNAFPMFADVEILVDDPDNEGEKIPVEERIFGYADYWGVYIDPRGQRLVEAGVTEFTPEVFGDQVKSETAEFFTVAETEVRVEKRSKSFTALNDLDKLKLAMYVQDAYWSTEYKSLLGFDVFAVGGFQEYEGYFDATDQKFVFDKGIKFFPNYEVTELETQIEFTPADWISKMKKVEDYGWIDEDGQPVVFTDVRPLGVWSNDTRQWYDISPAALKDPTLAAPVGEPPEFFDPFDPSRGGITTESTEFISPADLPQDLVCMQDCLTPEKVQATFLYAYCAQNGGEDPENCSGYTPSETGSAPAPFADGGTFLSEDASVTRVFSDEDAKNLVSTFYMSDPNNVLKRDGFKLATGNAQLVDYVYIPVNEAQGVDEAMTLPKTMAIAKNGKEGGRLDLFVQGSLDEGNLNRFIANTGGQAPLVTFDLESAPAVGDSGTTTVGINIVRIVEGDDESSTISAEVPVLWEGTTAGFQLSIPKDAAFTLGYLKGETSIRASGINPRNRILGYTGGVATNRGRPGLTLKLLSLFNGNTWDRVGLQSPTFFEPNSFYFVEVDFGDGFTFAELSDDPDQVLTQVSLGFTTHVDESSFTETFTKGQYWDGIRATSLIRYKPNSSGFDVGSVPLSKGAVINQYVRGVDDPWNAFGNATYTRPDGWADNLSYGLRTGQLVKEDDLAKLECNSDNDGVYEDHPVFTGSEESETRYCAQKLYETIGLTTYSISLDLQPSYALLDASGEAVTIAAPRTMYYEVPDAEAFGRDGGKRLSLEFAGHGELRGVPGFVYDTVTGEDKGEYVNEWKDTYRYLSRFTIPDGSTVTDLTGTTYFVKALDGEEWLKALDETESDPGEYTLTFSDLLEDEALSVLGEPGAPEDYIGEPPTCEDPTNVQTCALLNKGQPAVVHGELVVGADPTPLLD